MQNYDTNQIFGVDRKLIEDVLTKLYDKLFIGNKKHYDQFLVFISYAWVSDTDPPDWSPYNVFNEMLLLKELLEAKWTRRGFKVFLDLKSNRPDGSLDDYINHIIDADAVLCILTPAYKAKFDTTGYALCDKEKPRLAQRRTLRASKEQDSRIYPYIWSSEGSNPTQHLADCRPSSWEEPNFTTRSLVGVAGYHFFAKLKIILKELLVARELCGFHTHQEKTFEKNWARIDQVLSQTSKINTYFKPLPPTQLKSITQAAAEDDVEVLYDFIHQRVDLDLTKDKNHWTALHHAAANGHVDAIELLLQNGASVNVECTNSHNTGWTPLFNAVWCGQKDAVVRLLEWGAKSDLRVAGAYSGQNVLDIARAALRNAQNNHPQNLERLKRLTEFPEFLQSILPNSESLHNAEFICPRSGYLELKDILKGEKGNTKRIEFICPHSASIEVAATLKGLGGHWHIQGFINGEDKGYFMLLHNPRPVDVGAVETGTFLLSTKPGDKVLITAGANEPDVFEKQLFFSINIQPVQDTLSIHEDEHTSQPNMLI